MESRHGERTDVVISLERETAAGMNRPKQPDS
jgi:hypothetical protein